MVVVLRDHHGSNYMIVVLKVTIGTTTPLQSNCRTIGSTTPLQSNCRTIGTTMVPPLNDHGHVGLATQLSDDSIDDGPTA
jgi:hypothetical protein